MPMTSNSGAESAPSTSRRPRPPAWRTWAALAVIALLSAYFNTINLWGWDGSTGQHPDERFMTMVADRLKAPASLDEYLDSARSPINPRNMGAPFYVYGMLPQLLVHYTAVALTPAEALPRTIAPPRARDYGQGQQIANPDLRAPKIAPLQRLLNPSGKDATNYYTVVKVGRAWSALFATLSVLLVFLIGRRLYGTRTGLLAALLLALAALPIQLAHFFTVDSATACFTLLAVYWAVRVSQNGGWGSALALGLSIGAAMACRVTMASLGLLAILAVAQRLWQVRTFGAERPPSSDVYYSPARRPLGFWAGAGMLMLAGLVSVLTFRMLQPDAFVGSSFFDLRPEPRFVDNIREIGAAVAGQADSPPSQQWAGRTRFAFALQNIIIWGMGLPLGLLAWLAWAVVGVQIARAAWAGWSGRGWSLLARRLKHLLPWFWVTFYFAWQGGIFGMTMRYYLQLYGLLALLAAWALVRMLGFRLLLSDWRPRRSRWYGLQAVARWVPLVLVVLGTLAWAYAFTRIYTRPHSRIAAARWMYANIPAGAAVSSEQWDDALPISIDGRRAFDPPSGGWYYNVQTYPYAEDDPAKYTGYVAQDGRFEPGLLDHLDQVDYIVLSSNRVYGSATRLPMRYPALTRYYHYLFSGELGFRQVADITSYPTLLGIAIPDQGAEEAFSVYDHPRVLIFEKTPAYSRAEAERLITGDIVWSEVYKLSSFRGGRVPTALRLTDTQWPAYRDAGSFAELFNPAGLSNQLPWLFWLLALELLGLALFPLLFRLLPGLPDRGFALAKPLALLLVAYAAWLLGSWRLLAFGPGSVWLGTGLLLALGGWLGWRGRAELLAFARRRRRALIVAEGLFLLAFLGFVLIRALNPDLWHPARGGEKPMDLAFLTAVVKSPSFPPYDPWFAGGYINYYYFGFVLVGALVHLTGIVPTTAYNLAVPALFALTALGAWGVAYNLLAPGDGARTSADERGAERGGARTSADERGAAVDHPRLPAIFDRRAIVTGVVAAVFVVLLGPLTQAIWFLPGSGHRPLDDVRPECRFSSYAAQQNCVERGEWAFWDATRVIGMRLQDSTISEFPFFTFLFADLHAHMIALPLALLALGLMVAMLRGTLERWNVGTLERWNVGARFLVFGLLALVIGALRATNTWDFPAYLALGCATLGLAHWHRWQAGASLPHSLLAWAGGSLALLVGSTLLFQPFLRSFVTDYAGFELWRGARTPAAEFLKINGLWLFLLISGALLIYWRRGAGLLWLLVIGLGPLLLVPLALWLQAPALLLLVPLALGGLAILANHVSDTRRAPALPSSPDDLPYVQLALPLLDATYSVPSAAPASHPVQTLPRAHPATQLAITWALGGLLLTLASELVVARGDIGRMNTVFKLGMQSWTLFALAGALAWHALWPLAARRPLVGWAWRAAAVLLVAAALVYPLTATPARLADRIDSAIEPTLDGTAFMRSAKGGWAENGQQFGFAEDAAALEWLRANVAGSPIVLEAHTEAYRWGGRVSIYTGLPTLLGWPWHETQQRLAADVGPVLAGRQALIQRLYGSGDQAEVLRSLQQYGVEYVYVGQLERALYPPAGLAAFDALAQAGQIGQVYAAGGTRIYRVPRAEAPPVVVATTLEVRAPTLAAPRSTQLDAPVFTLPRVGEYAWNGLAQSDAAALLLWLLACYALQALGLPLALLIFGRGHGTAATSIGVWAWARLIGLLLLGYAVWLPVSMRLWSYSRWSLLWGALLVLALNATILAWLGRRMQNVALKMPQGGNSQFYILNSQFKRGLGLISDYWRAQRRSIVIAEALFLGGFAGMALLRALNPDLWQPFWGGEKPMEFGFLNAILRSPSMPPYDPFFSDGKINYYYYGLFLASLPIKATGIAPAAGFNLTIATLFALTLLGAFALAARLAGRLRYGLAGAAFTTLLGNLAAAFPVGWGQGLAPVRAALEQGGLAGFGARLDSWFIGPSRVIIIPDRLMTINEFPYWSYLFADLHPHLIAMPIALLVAALAFELFLEPRTKNQEPAMVTEDSRFSVLGSWFLAALALGALAITNSWDLPTYALLIGGALLGQAWRTGARGRALAWALLGAGLRAGAITIGALLLYLPFFQNYVPPAGVRGIGLVRDGSPLGPFVLIYGLYLLILGLWAGGVALRLLRRRRALQPARLPAGPLLPTPPAGQPEFAEAQELPEDTRGQALGIVARPPGLRTNGLLLIAAPAVLLLLVLASPGAAGAVWNSPLLLKAGLLALLLAGVPALLARRLPARAWFTLWLAVLAWAVALGVELIYIRDHLDGGDAYRMNTVFKFGLQAWMLMAVAAAAALPWLGRGLRRAGTLAQVLGWGVIGALVALALVFPLVGTPSRVAYRFPQSPGPTLDGLAFMRQAEFDLQPSDIGRSGGVVTRVTLNDDLEAIRWLNREVRGTPIVLQSDLWFYRPYGVRIAANTGLPTIVSPLHASEQHDPEEVAARDRDVQLIYNTPDLNEALRLLSRYHVGYIYIGQIERAAYAPEGIAKFARLDGTLLKLAYQNASVTIYKVNDGVHALTSAAEIPPPPEQPQPPAGQPAQPAQPAQPQGGQVGLEQLEQQVAANPAGAGPVFELAQRYRALGRLEDAVAILNIAAPANPKDVALHQLWGDTLRDAGQVEAAEQAYRNAVAADPTAGNWNKLGLELLKWGRLDDATAAFEQALNADANAADPHFHLGEIAEQQGDADRAAEHYRAYLTVAGPEGPFADEAQAGLVRLQR